MDVVFDIKLDQVFTLKKWKLKILSIYFIKLGKTNKKIKEFLCKSYFGSNRFCFFDKNK